MNGSVDVQKWVIAAVYFVYLILLCVAAAVEDMRRWTVAAILLLHSSLLAMGVAWNAFRSNAVQLYGFKNEHVVLAYQTYDAIQLFVGIGLLTTPCSRAVWFAWSVALIGCFLCFYKTWALNSDEKNTHAELAQTTRSMSSDTLNENKELQKWNIRAFLLHSGSALFMAPWVRHPLRCMDVDEWHGMATWTTSKWQGINGTDVNCATEQCIVARCTHKVGKGVPLESLTFAFHFGSALAHLYYAVADKNYCDMVRARGNWWRWVEYGITAPIMIVVIMSSSGFTDVWTLTCAAVLTAITQAFGWLAENSITKSDGLHWQIFGVGAMCAIPPWIALFTIWITNITDTGASVPWFVTAIIIGLFLLFTSFALVMYARLRACKGKFTIPGLGWTWAGHWPGEQKDANLHAEKCYIALSFISKATLAWLLWAGAFRRSANDLQQAPLPSC